MTDHASNYVSWNMPGKVDLKNEKTQRIKKYRTAAGTSTLYTLHEMVLFNTLKTKINLNYFQKHIYTLH